MDARVKPAHDDCGCSRIKHDDAAYRLAGFHGGKALVDLGQFQLRRNPVLEMQLAAHVEFDQPRHVDAEMVGAHRRALDFSFAQEIKAMQLDLLAERDHADDCRGAAGGQHRKRLLRGLLAPEHFERVMHPTTRELARTCCTTSPFWGSTMSVAPSFVAN